MDIVFDIGGTKMRFARSGDGASIEDSRIVSTPQEYDRAVSVAGEVVAELCGGSVPDGAAGGIAGAWDTDHVSLIWSPNLRNWIGKPIYKDLAQAIGTDPILENDAAVAGLGEALRGAGVGKPIVAYLTVSTGVGGARIVDGGIDQSAFGFEPGHQVVDDSGLSLEQLVAGAGIYKRFGIEAKAIKDEKVWKEAARLLARGIRNTMLNWSPSVVVLGGSMMVNDEVYWKYTLSAIAEQMEGFPFSVPVKRAALGDDAGLTGALCLLEKGHRDE